MEFTDDNDDCVFGRDFYEAVMNDLGNRLLQLFGEEKNDINEARINEIKSIRDSMEKSFSEFFPEEINPDFDEDEDEDEDYSDEDDTSDIETAEELLASGNYVEVDLSKY